MLGAAPDELCKNKVIDFMPGQSDEIDKGGTLRLGAYPCDLKNGTVIEKAYRESLAEESHEETKGTVVNPDGTVSISERHRHRYEFNNEYREVLEQAGLTLSGLSPDKRLVETVEITDRPFHVGVQFHPEFKSRPDRSHPLFTKFIEAALNNKKKNN